MGPEPRGASGLCSRAFPCEYVPRAQRTSTKAPNCGVRHDHSIFFIKGGMNVSLSEVAGNWHLLLVLFGVKSVAKFIGVWPLAKRYANDHAGYLTLLMS